MKYKVITDLFDNWYEGEITEGDGIKVCFRGAEDVWITPSLHKGWFEEVKRWKPEEDDEYWVVSLNTDERAYSLIWENDEHDKNHYKHHNCFKTEKEALKAANKVKELLASLHKE